MPKKQESGPSTSSANNDSGLTSNSASTSNKPQQQWMYISRPELVQWTEGWKCINPGCESTLKVYEDTYYLLKCGHRVCDECKKRETAKLKPSKAVFQCWSCKKKDDPFHNQVEMNRLNEASYINMYRDELNQRGIPCTTCHEKHNKMRYYPRDLMYVCTREKCSDVLDENVVYDIYGHHEQVHPVEKDEESRKQKEEIGEFTVSFTLTRVCLYCKSDGKHSEMDVFRRKKDCRKNNGGESDRTCSPGDHDHLFNECDLEPIVNFDGLKATMAAKLDKLSHTSVRTPWHLQMLDESFMRKLSKDMLSCCYCKASFKNNRSQVYMRRCHRHVACKKCSDDHRKQKKCEKDEKKNNRLNNTYENEIFPRLYELDFTSARKLAKSSYQECHYCNRVHSVDYLRKFKNAKNEIDRCCLDCMLRVGIEYNLLRKQVFEEKLKITN